MRYHRKLTACGEIQRESKIYPLMASPRVLQRNMHDTYKSGDTKMPTIETQKHPSTPQRIADSWTEDISMSLSFSRNKRFAFTEVKIWEERLWDGISVGGDYFQVCDFCLCRIWVTPWSCDSLSEAPDGLIKCWTANKWVRSKEAGLAGRKEKSGREGGATREQGGEDTGVSHPLHNKPRRRSESKMYRRKGKSPEAKGSGEDLRQVGKKLVKLRLGIPN